MQHNYTDNASLLWQYHPLKMIVMAYPENLVLTRKYHTLGLLYKQASRPQSTDAQGFRVCHNQTLHCYDKSKMFKVILNTAHDTFTL